MIRLFIMLLTISYAHADILEREDVQNFIKLAVNSSCLLYTSPSPRDLSTSRMPSSA